MRIRRVAACGGPRNWVVVTFGCGLVSRCEISGLALLLFAGCGKGGESTTTARGSARASPAPSSSVATAKPGPGDQQHPIPLEQALAKGLCVLDEVSSIPFSSRFVRFILNPKVTTQPWIEVEAGWKLTSRKDEGVMVTVLPAAGRLGASSRSSITVPAAEIARSHSAPVQYDGTRLPAGDPCLRLVTAAQSLDPVPSWNVLQTAVSVLARDIDFKAMRAEKYSASQESREVIILGGAGGATASNIGVIDEAQQLLQRAGEATARFKLFREADETYARALADWNAAGRGDLQALNTLGFFRTRPEAFAILASGWTSRPADKKSYRETALRALSSGLVDYTRRPYRIDAQVRAALADGLEKETDPILRRSIADELNRAAKAEKPSAASL